MGPGAQPGPIRFSTEPAYRRAVLTTPTLADLRETSAIFTSFGDVDRATRELEAATHPALDLANPGHRDALLRWLNAWGCRIRMPRAGEPTPFQDSIGAWWAEWGGALPTRPLARLDETDIARLGAAHEALSALPVTAGDTVRTLSSTAAAKALFAIRPRTVVPWDAAIAVAMHGARDGEAFARRQRLGRDWARALLHGTGLTETKLSAAAGRPGVPLAKLLDEYCYVRITYARREPRPSRARRSRAAPAPGHPPRRRRPEGRA
jgi:hypothetical protein